MNNFLYDFQCKSFLDLFKKYWTVLIFGPIIISILIMLLGGRLWMAIMVGFCKIDGFLDYFPSPFGSDCFVFAVFPTILFLLLYFCFLFFRKIWLLIPSVFFLTFPIEIAYENIIHDDYNYIGGQYLAFLDNEKIGVMDCWRNTILSPTYEKYIPCFEYREDGHRTKASSLVLCLFFKDARCFVFTCHEQLVEVERVVLNPKYRKKEKDIFSIYKKDNTFDTLLESKKHKHRRLYSLQCTDEKFVLGYLMSVNRYHPTSIEERNTAEYHFISSKGAYLGGGKYYILGHTEADDEAIGFSKNKKTWDIVAMHHDDAIYYTSSDEDITRESREIFEEYDTSFVYNVGFFCQGIYLSNRIKPNDDTYILENNIEKHPSQNNNITSDTNYYPTTHMVAKPQTCGICSGTGSCTTCYGRGIISIGSGYIKCGACGGRGRCATCNGSGVSGTVQVLEYY